MHTWSGTPCFSDVQVTVMPTDASLCTGVKLLWLLHILQKCFCAFNWFSWWCKEWAFLTTAGRTCVVFLHMSDWWKWMPSSSVESSEYRAVRGCWEMLLFWCCPCFLRCYSYVQYSVEWHTFTREMFALTLVLLLYLTSVCFLQIHIYDAGFFILICLLMLYLFVFHVLALLC